MGRRRPSGAEYDPLRELDVDWDAVRRAMNTGDTEALERAIYNEFYVMHDTSKGRIEAVHRDSTRELWLKARNGCDRDEGSAVDLYFEALADAGKDLTEHWDAREPSIQNLRSYVATVIRKKIGERLGDFQRRRKLTNSFDVDSIRAAVDRPDSYATLSDPPAKSMSLEMWHTLLDIYIKCRDQLPPRDRGPADIVSWGVGDVPINELPLTRDALEAYLVTFDGRGDALVWGLTTNPSRFVRFYDLGNLPGSQLGRVVSQHKERFKARLARCMVAELEARELDPADFFEGDWEQYLWGDVEVEEEESE